jgi:predicted nucleotidyltransferase
MLEAEIHPVREELRRHGVRTLRVFGSVARETARIDSDIDFLVGFDPQFRTLDDLLAVGDVLEKALGRKVDLVTEDGLSPYLAPHVLKEARHVELAQ